ncbi:lysozyme inhibitor LprI family protein [Caulobacter sp. 1776]|uniref:lysozyme inhibitor LprI family protein n=1 Tax=Caulobacter sp. 1776 TaxID=3156420 RepID=UPI0033987A85
MTRLFAAVLLLTAAVAPAAHAEDPKYSPAYDRCLAAPSGQSTMGMIECIGIEFEAQDARLNRAYRTAMKRMELPRQKAALQKAQRAWIAFRDADCASLYDQDWGTISRVEAANCRLDRTARRADALEDFRKQG